jgi:hypothetical protein
MARAARDQQGVDRAAHLLDDAVVRRVGQHAQAALRMHDGVVADADHVQVVGRRTAAQLVGGAEHGGRPGDVEFLRRIGRDDDHNARRFGAGCMAGQVIGRGCADHTPAADGASRS